MRPRPLRPVKATLPLSRLGDGQAPPAGAGQGGGQDLDATLSAVVGPLGQEKSFDVVVRRIRVAGRPAALVYLDGFLQPVP
ncbi:MAG TPA: hypothetical protein VIK90_02650, partial [Limnochordales bacterium]